MSLLLLLLLLFSSVIIHANPNPNAIANGNGNDPEENEENEGNVGKTEMKVMELTDEFQVIPKGYSLPGGVDVRINLQTGLKEARRLPVTPSHHHHHDNSNDDNNNNNNNNVNKENEESLTIFLPADAANSDLQLKEMNELKDQMKAVLKMEKQVESMLLPDCLEICESFYTNVGSVSYNQMMETLQSTKDILHDFDHSSAVSSKMIIFLRLLHHLTYNSDRLFNQETQQQQQQQPQQKQIEQEEKDAMTRLVLQTIAVAMSNQPDIQESVFKYDNNSDDHPSLSPILLHILINSPQSDIQASAVYALGTFVRGFPQAQYSFFFKHNGLQIIRNHWDFFNEKPQLKLLTLFEDIRENDVAFDATLSFLSSLSPIEEDDNYSN